MCQRDIQNNLFAYTRAIACIQTQNELGDAGIDVIGNQIHEHRFPAANCVRTFERAASVSAAARQPVRLKTAGGRNQ